VLVKGENGNVLFKEFNIGSLVLYNITNQEDGLFKFVSSSGISKGIDSC
jgi:hypothetical protein